MWPNPQDTTNLVTFTEKILNGKLHFFCSVKVFRTFGAHITWEEWKLLNTDFHILLRVIIREEKERQKVPKWVVINRKEVNMVFIVFTKNIEE